MNSFKALLVALSPYVVMIILFYCVFYIPNFIVGLCLIGVAGVFVWVTVGWYKDAKNYFDAKDGR